MDQPKSKALLLPKTDRVTLGVVSLFVSLALVQIFWETPSAVVAKLSDKVDLSGTWQTCVLNDGEISSSGSKLVYQGRPIDGQCSWTQATVPNALPLSKLSTEKGWIVYRRVFQAPGFCTDTSPCNVIASEVGDAALVALNQKEIAVHGGLPPHERYSRHYPLNVSIPNSLLTPNGTNELWMVVRYMKKEQSGILRGPLAIVPADDAFSISRRTLVQNVLLPLMSAIGVALMAVLGVLLMLMGRERNAKAGSYLRYCFASAVFLISYTSIPREFLPLPVTGCLHFLFRFLMDATFLEMALVFTGWRPGLKPWVRCVYGAALSVFILQFTLPQSFFSGLLQDWGGFSGAVRWSRVIDYGLIFGAYLLGSFAAVMKRKMVGPAVVATFSLSAIFSLAGCLTFHGMTNLPYFVMIYPFFIALVVGIEIAIVFLVQDERTRRDAILGHVTGMIVHNMRSPLTSMWHNLELATELIPKRAHSMRELCLLMSDMMNTIIPNAEKLLAAQDRVDPQVLANSTTIEVSHLASLLEVAVSSKRTVVGNSVEIDLDLSEGGATFAKVNPTTLKQVVANLLDNAVDALKNRSDGVVEVSLREERGRAFVIVQDNGCGMSSAQLKRIGEKGFTQKIGGNGYGVHYCQEVLRAVGGKIEIQSTVNVGTRIVAVIPSEPTPQWFAKSITLPENARVVVLDDDPGIREMMRERLNEMEVPTEIFSSPEKAQAWLGDNLTESDVLLFDHLLMGKDITGLDLLSKVPDPTRCYLVTSYFNDSKVISRCEKLSVRLIPKSSIALIEIERTAESVEAPGLRVGIFESELHEEENSEA